MSLFFSLINKQLLPIYLISGNKYIIDVVGANNITVDADTNPVVLVALNYKTVVSVGTVQNGVVVFTYVNINVPVKLSEDKLGNNF